MEPIKKFFLPQIMLYGAILTASYSNSYAGELVYHPINPAFGGNPSNYSWLLESANAQNEYKETDPLKTFDTDLKRRILSLLETKIANAAFGSYNDELTSGQYQIGSYNISISTDGGGINVNILDQSTGATSAVSVPYY